MTIEDAAELRLRQPHVVRLESRPASVEGRGEVTIRDLLRNALRMRPDRIVIGEVRGAEALDLLTALNTGHEGALSTVHANSPEDALRRIETLALMAGVGLPHEAIREQLCARHRPRRPHGPRPRRAAGGDHRRRGVALGRGGRGPRALEARVSAVAWICDRPCGARGWARRARRARGAARHPGGGPLGRGDARAASPRRPRGPRCRRTPSAAGSRSSAGSSFFALALLISGPGAAPLLAAAGPAAASAAIARRRARYRRRVEGGLAEIATAIADALASGRSARAALAAAASSLEGPAAVEIGARSRRARPRRADSRCARRPAPAPRLAARRCARGRAALPAARRRRPRHPAAPLRRRGRRPRAHRGGRARGNRAGPVHRSARRRDAGRRRAAGRAARARASSPGCWPSPAPPPCSRSRPRSSSPGSPRSAVSAGSPKGERPARGAARCCSAVAADLGARRQRSRVAPLAPRARSPRGLAA